MIPHTSKTFEEELESLRTRVMTMGGTVESQIRMAMAAYEQHDTQKAQAVLDAARVVRRERGEADQLSAEVIALRQPAAKDLRLLLGFIRVLSDLKRISKQAAKIAKIVLREQRSVLPRINGIFQAADMAANMLRQALDTVGREDAQAARTVIQDDAHLDEQYAANMRQLITYMMEDPRTITAALDTLWIAKALERMGDYAENIAEVAIYIAEGEDVRYTEGDDE